MKIKNPKIAARYTQVYDLDVNLTKYYNLQQPQPTGCIEWTGCRHRQNYGFFSVLRHEDGQRIMAVVHRIAMRLKLNRAITSEEDVAHTCGNPLCCNPDHLEIRQPARVPRKTPQLDLHND
jgi:hypothetical protein